MKPTASPIQTYSFNDAVQRPQRTNWKLGLLVAVCLLIGAGLIFGADGYIARNFQHHYLPGELRRLVTWTEMFGHGLGVGLIAVGIYLLAPRHRRYLPRLIACPLLAGALVSLLKFAIQRTRPMAMYEFIDFTKGQWWVGWNQELLGRQAKIGYNFQSFPSGHAATAFAFAIGMSWMFPRGRWYFMTLAVLASLQRSAYLAHWASDVFIGAAIGVLAATLVTGTRLGELCYEWWELRRPHDGQSAGESNEAEQRLAA